MEIKKTVGIVITARVKSSRIHEKVLQKIGNKRAIEILLDNVTQDKYEVVLAIPQSEDCDILEKIGIERGVLVHRGQDDSPLHRLAAVAKYYEYDYIVRITADDILIDPEIMSNQIRFALARDWDYCYCKRTIDGTAGEVIKSSVLQEVAKKLSGRSIEFVSYYIKDKYKTVEYYPHHEFQHNYRCVLDYPEDLLFVRVLHSVLPHPVRPLDIIHFLKRNPFLTSINKLPEVTIYTCNYNTAAYIVPAMQSVMDQIFEDYEYIIIDDCSTDDSCDVITEFITELPEAKRKKISFFRNAENKGLSACSNIALKKARGKYILRLDSDDTLLPDCLHEMLTQIKIESAAGMLSGYWRIDEKGEAFEQIKENRWHPGCALLSTWACNEIKYREDIEYLDGKYFYDEWKKHFKTAFSPLALWCYRQRPGQKTQSPEHPENKK